MITIAFVLIVQSLYAYYTWEYTHSDWTIIEMAHDFIRSKFFDLVGFVVVMPIVTLALLPLQNRLLAWRKLRGRDILEEEKYETESGILTLTEKR